MSADNFNPFDPSQYKEPVQVFKQLDIFEAPSEARGEYQPKAGQMDYVWKLEPTSFRMKGEENVWWERMTKSNATTAKLAKWMPAYREAIRAATGVTINSIEDARAAGNGLYFEVTERLMGKSDSSGKYRHCLRVVPEAEAQNIQAASTPQQSAPVIPMAPRGAAEDALLSLIGEGKTYDELRSVAATADVPQQVLGTMMAGIYNRSLVTRLVQEGRLIDDNGTYRTAVSNPEPVGA